MAYGLKYEGNYTSKQGHAGLIRIFEKDYTGDVIPLLLSANPAVQEYNTDEAKPSIKGSSLTVTYLNEGNIPLTDFYSTEDDHFKIENYINNHNTFVGYLVQDNCTEEMVDYIHEVTLSANDNLGLLKDIPLNQNVPDIGMLPAGVKLFYDAPHCYVYLYNTDYIPTVSQPFLVLSHFDPAANTTFTPTAVTLIGNGNWKVQIADSTFTSDTISWPSFIFVHGTINLYNRNTLLTIIRICLYNTGLELETVILANIFEESQNTPRSFLEQTYVSTQVFLSGDTFKSCWDCLDIILSTFKLTLFQTASRWFIVRWDEIRYSNTSDIDGFIYDSVFGFQGTTTRSGFSYINYWNLGFDQPIYPETAPLKSIIRPYKFVRETLNYVQPKYLLRNFDLQELGSSRGSYTDGSNTIYEYDAPGWFDSFFFSPDPDYFIRIVKDTATDTEIDRYFVISGSGGAVMATPFEVSEGDKIVFEFTFETVKSQPGPGTIILGDVLYDGTTTNYADEDRNINWKTTLGWNYSIPSGGNTNQSQSVTIDPGAIPYDGLIYLSLPQADLTAGAGDETRIRNIRLTYTPYINKSSQITGHVHDTETTSVIKNNSDTILTIDDTPRNSIVGTLFLPSFSSLIQDRTVFWYRSSNTGERLRIGEIITGEEMAEHSVPRTKIEGTFHNIFQGVDFFSPLSVINYSLLTGIYFILGRYRVNFKDCSFDATLYEIGQAGNSVTTDATFFGGVFQININSDTQIIFVGDSFTVTGSLYNNTTFTVYAVVMETGYMRVYVNEAVAEELSATNITFTIYSGSLYGDYTFKYLYSTNVSG